MKNPVKRTDIVVKGEPERMRTGECMPKEDRDVVRPSLIGCSEKNEVS
jgi:hypothetical protein